MSTVSRTTTDRRRGARRIPRVGVRVECLKGSTGLGHNLAEGLIDLSATGVRLKVRAPLDPGQEVELSLQGQAYSGPIKRFASVVSCREAPGGGWEAGVSFRTHLSYAELGSLT